MPEDREKPAVIVVNSLVARGSVGGRAAAFVLERLGFRVWWVPTVTLAWHPGHGRATRLQPDEATFATFVSDLVAAPWLGEIAAIMTGYLGAATQAGPIAGLVDAVRRANPRALYLCDPVIGDGDGLFQPEAVGVAIHDMLMPRADIATPNRHELAWLTGTSPADTDELIAAARALGPPEVVVTSAFAEPDAIGNLLVDREGAYRASHRLLPDVPHGTGDLLSPLYLGHRLDGLPPLFALERAAAATVRLIELARDLGADEMPLAAGQAAFVAPPQGITIETLEGPARMTEWVAGVDGCPAGWAVVYRRLDDSTPPEFAVAADFSAILDDPRRPAIVAVDMPIGLPDRAGRGGRGPESAVRPLLGRRQSSVFSVPSRTAVMADDYIEACRIALETSDPPRKVSKQSYHLFPKIREIDALMTRDLEGRVFECHPELAFWRLNGERPMALPKKIKSRVNPAGVAERQALLARYGYDEAFLFRKLPRHVGRDDMIDAAALALIAMRIARGDGESFPAEPQRDSKGLRMAIWA